MKIEQDFDFESENIELVFVQYELIQNKCQIEKFEEKEEQYIHKDELNIQVC
jgi:hypothetical protein